MSPVETSTGGPSKKHRVYVSIERFIVKNFKSLEDVKLTVLPGVNLLVGPNASGKSNILEAIAFLKKALVDAAGRTPYVPYVPWYWEALDVVYRRDPERPVTLGLGGTLYIRLDGMEYGKASFDFEVTMVYDAASATLKPHTYKLSLGGSKVTLSPESLIIEIPTSVLEEVRELMKAKVGDKAIASYTVKDDIAIATIKWPAPPPDLLLPSALQSWPRVTLGSKKSYIIAQEEVIVPLRRSIITAFKLEKANLNEVRGFSFKGPPIMILSPLWMMSWGIHEILEGIIFLRHPDIGAVGKPREIRGSMYLSERAENLGEVLLTLQAKSGSLPDPIVYALKKGFPGLTVRLEIGLGRVALVAEEMGVRLNPPNMPDGLIKLLAIATAASLEPSVLLIDELENSMHAELLELAIDMLNRLETPVLIATHSPLVVDMVEPERVIVLSKEPGGPTRVERLSEKRDLLRRLEELGVSLGDAVFHSVTRRD